MTKAGETIQLTASVVPADAANQKVAWFSSDEKVATVDAGGKVTAAGNGSCVIMAVTEEGGKTAVCKITVLLITPPTAEPSVTWIPGSPTASVPESTVTPKPEASTIPTAPVSESTAVPKPETSATPRQCLNRRVSWNRAIELWRFLW